MSNKILAPRVKRADERRAGAPGRFLERAGSVSDLQGTSIRRRFHWILRLSGAVGFTWPSTNLDAKRKIKLST
jgi:hypothetical protein